MEYSREDTGQHRQVLSDVPRPSSVAKDKRRASGASLTKKKMVFALLVLFSSSSAFALEVCESYLGSWTGKFTFYFVLFPPHVKKKNQVDALSTLYSMRVRFADSFCEHLQYVCAYIYIYTIAEYPL